MKVTTTRFGDIEYRDDMVLTFPSGLIGFPEATRFLILDHDRQVPFKWLQSVDDGALAFVIMDPAVFKPDYRVSVARDCLPDLGCLKEDDLLMFVVLTVPSDDPIRMTANLRGPVIVNHRTRMAKQVILHEEWPIRYPLFPSHPSQSMAGRPPSLVSCPS